LYASIAFTTAGEAAAAAGGEVRAAAGSRMLRAETTGAAGAAGAAGLAPLTPCACSRFTLILCSTSAGCSKVVLETQDPKP
jgi:hypothetical protein